MGATQSFQFAETPKILPFSMFFSVLVNPENSRVFPIFPKSATPLVYHWLETTHSPVSGVEFNLGLCISRRHPFGDSSFRRITGQSEFGKRLRHGAGYSRSSPKSDMDQLAYRLSSLPYLKMEVFA